MFWKSKLLVLFLLLFAVSSYADELREVEYFFGVDNVKWETTATHVICDGCPPLERLSYRDYEKNLKVITGRKQKGEADDIAVKVEVVKRKRFHSIESCTSCSEKAKGLEEKGRITLYFDFDDYRLRPEEFNRLKELVRSLSPAKFEKVELTGYTCDIGTKTYNDRLAFNRALSVKEALERLGITDGSIEVSGKGKCCYISNVRSRNRRVEVIFR